MLDPEAWLSTEISTSSLRTAISYIIWSMQYVPLALAVKKRRGEDAIAMIAAVKDAPSTSGHYERTCHAVYCTVLTCSWIYYTCQIHYWIDIWHHERQHQVGLKQPVCRSHLELWQGRKLGRQSSGKGRDCLQQGSNQGRTLLLHADCSDHHISHRQFPN